MYIMEIVHYIKMTIAGLEQNSSMIIIHVIDQIINPSYVELIFKKKKVNKTGIRWCNKLPNHFKI